MTVRETKRSVLLPILAVVAIGVVLRFTFVDALTKLTGTWMGGVESPRRSGSVAGTDPLGGESPGTGPSAA